MESELDDNIGGADFIAGMEAEMDHVITSMLFGPLKSVLPL